MNLIYSIQNNVLNFFRRRNVFTKSAKYYDLMKSSKNYQEEANQIIDILNHYGIFSGHILDLACGTGEHDKYLKSQFQTDGLDLNKDFVEIAKTKNPEGTYYTGNMIDFETNKAYDTVICLYGSIGYTKSLENLSKMISTCKMNLKKDGLLIIEPWYNPNNWEADIIHTTNVESESISITRMATGNRDGEIIFHYLIGEKGKGIEYFTETYEFGLFTHEELMDVFHKNKFDAVFISHTVQKRGLYVAKSL